MSDSVVITYETGVPATPTSRAYVAGESYTLPDAATAQEVHPEATITKYADGRPFDPKTDASLAAAKEEEKAAKSKKGNGENGTTTPAPEDAE